MLNDSKLITFSVLGGFLAGGIAGTISGICIRHSANTENTEVALQAPSEIIDEGLLSLMDRAHQNDLPSLEKLAEAYETGEQIEQNLSKALTYRKKAADLGGAESAYLVGYAYENGIGIKENGVKAEKYYWQAAKKGHPKAQYSLALHASGLKEDDDGPFSSIPNFNIPKDKALSLLKKSAAQNYALAEHMLANVYLEEKQYDQAIQFYEKAAKHGEPNKWNLEKAKNGKMNQAINIENPSTEILSEFDDGEIKYKWEVLLTNTSDVLWSGSATFKLLDINGKIIDDDTKFNISIPEKKSIRIDGTSFISKQKFDSKTKININVEYSP